MIASVQSENQEDVAIHLKQRDGEVIAGLVITVMDARKNEAVFVNVVGRIKADNLRSSVNT